MYRRDVNERHLFTKGLLTTCCFILLSVATACNQEEAQQTSPTTLNTPTQELSPSPTLSPKPMVLPYTFALTGLPSSKKVENRPFMIMVENTPAARPQSGLDQADIVYEVLAEGEITRFLSVFQSEAPGKIGPVRSIRPYFVELGVGFDAMLVHAGWSQDGMNMMVKLHAAHLDEVYGDGDSYWRSTDRKPPHNLYTSIVLATKGAERRKFRMEWNDPFMHFAKDGQSVQGQPATKVDIPYIMGYKVAYEYDALTGVYKRIMAGIPHLDKETKKQLTATNVLVIEAKHRILDNAGRRSVDVNGPGTGFIFQQGKMQEITWNRTDGIIRAYIGKTEVPMLPGKTWVQIVPLGTQLTWH
ncbi:MAG: DUF3048 domain-containing protein [Gorillibacterium sp.]|nr:DUF3048 domain-containing protein [Gorillibacterium sp.]